jgi:cell division protein ZapA
MPIGMPGWPEGLAFSDGIHGQDRADRVGHHVRQVSGEVGHVGDLRLFLMAGLLLADELQEARTNGGAASVAADPVATTDGVAEALNAVAARLEKIAQGL